MQALALLNELEQNFDMSDFYCITLRRTTDNLEIQGRFTDNTVRVARSIGVELHYSNEMLVGEKNNLRIVLTT